MNRLRDLREDADLSLEKVGKKLGVYKSTIGDYENEELQMSTKALCSLADCYNTSTDYILYNTDDIIPHNITPRDKHNRLKEIRRKNKCTQLKIGNLLYLTQSGYSNYERGVADIPVPVLLKLSEFYKTSIDYLLCRTDNPSPYTKSKIKKTS